MTQEPGDEGRSSAPVTRSPAGRRAAVDGAGDGSGAAVPGLALLEGPRPPSPPPSPFAVTVATAVPSPPPVAAPTVRVRQAPGKLMAVGTALTVLGMGALALALCFTLVSQLMYARAQDIAYDDFRSALSRGTVPVGQTITEFPEAVAPAAGGTEDDAAAAPEAPQQRRVAPGTPIALMSVPAIGIDRAVVLEGTSGSVLQRGPGHQRNSAFPGQPGATSIFGRASSFGGVFGRAGQLGRGDEIRFTTGQIETTDGLFEPDAEIVYRVTTVRSAGDRVLQPDPAVPRLTLITAEGEPFLPEGVLYVDAVLDGEPRPAAFRQVTELPGSEAPLGRDGGAWVPVLLWSQGLLLAALGLTWLRVRWGRMQAWVVGTPVVAALAVGLTSAASLLLPNLL